MTAGNCVVGDGGGQLDEAWVRHINGACRETCEPPLPVLQ
jgi:hypothetical protein